MLEVGWSEILVIAVVLIVVVGPKDLPPMLRAFGKMTTRLRTMAGQFQTQFNEALKEADLDDVRKTLQDAQKLNPLNTLREAMTPLQQMGSDLKADLQKTVATPAPSPTILPPEPAPAAPVVVETPSVIPVEPIAAAEVPVKPKRVAKPKVKAEAVPVVEEEPVKPKRASKAKEAVAPILVAAEEPAKPKKKKAVKSPAPEGDA